MLYTRKGDAGTSGLFGTRDRFSKDSLVFEALGSLDELNSLLGVVYAHAHEESSDAIDIAALVRTVQQHIFIAQAELAGAGHTLDQAHIDWVEQAIETLEATIRNPHSFVIPGATKTSALFDFARAVCRRAERAVVRACAECAISAETRAYLNRLSSLLYALARHANTEAGAAETPPTYA